MSVPSLSPREGFVVIAGKPWLARMIDKSRLAYHGHLAALDLDYPCPLDQRLLRELGLSSDAFQALVIEHDTDDAIVQALKSQKCL